MRENLIKEVFEGKRTKCLNCRKGIKTGQTTVKSCWVDHQGKERFARFCTEECADEFYLDCLSRKSGVYF